MNKIKHILSLVFFIAFVTNVVAQTKVQVVTKKVTDEFKWKSGSELNIEGERAEITIETHNADVIEVQVSLISKHPDKAVAVKELEYLKWVGEIFGKKIYLRNYIELEKGKQKPQSNLKAIYQIKVPQSCDVNINNYFGKIEVFGLSGDLSIDGEFSKVFLNDYTGTSDIKSKFGDISAERSNGKITFISNRSDIILSNTIGGEYDIEAAVAEIMVTGTLAIRELVIKTEKSKVLFDTPELANQSFAISVESGEWKLPAWLDLNIEEESKSLKKASYGSSVRNVVVNMKYGTLEFITPVGSK